MRHYDRRSAPGCQPDRGIRRHSDRGNAGSTAQPTCGFPGTPPSAIVHTVPEFIWVMTVNTCVAAFNCTNRGPLKCEANRTCKGQFAALTCCLKNGSSISVHLIIPPAVLTKACLLRI